MCVRVFTFSYGGVVNTDVHQLPAFVQEQTQLSHEVHITDNLLDRLCGIRNDMVISVDLDWMVGVLSGPFVFRDVEEEFDSNH